MWPLVSCLVHALLPASVQRSNAVHTIEEIKERIAETLDEISVLELLNINSTELVERFEDKIEQRADYIENELFDDGDGEEEEI